MNQPSWCEQTDNLLKYLYEDLKIFNWELISKELSDRLSLQTNSVDCRKRYAEKYGPVIRNEWTPEQEKQLYRLHNQNGNKWAIIAQNLLGRNDNCVKNHFYSKLRKSLRTVNKITKLYLKKEAKEVSDVVLYKLTEATDESLKENPQLAPELTKMCYDLKNRLLDYETDQKDIKGGIDYSFQKQLIQGLGQFNRIYKKKPKKEKITILGTQNLKKRGSEPKSRAKKKQTGLYYDQDSSNEDISQDQISDNQDISEVLPKKRTSTRKIQLKNLGVAQNNTKKIQQIANESINQPPKSESEFSVARKTLNYVIKAPSKQQREDYEKPYDLLSESRKSIIEPIPHQNTTQPVLNLSSQKPRNKVEDILKAQGILENGDYNNGQKQSMKFTFSISRSSRSFSVCSESSNPDMFAQDLMFAGGFKELSQMDNESQQFFNQPSDGNFKQI